MGIIKKRKTSFTKIIIKSILLLGICMLLFSVGLLVLLRLFEHKGFFTSDIFPRIELLIFMVYILLMVLLIFLVSYLATKKIQKKGKVLIDITHKIKHQNLNFEIQPTNIVEIDKVLDALDELKMALSNSLSAQWKLEQSKQYQLSALMHDLKAPLTVLKGNLYLLNYETLSNDGSKAIEDMNSCISDMEYYIEELLEMSRNNKKESTDMTICDLRALLNEVISSMQVLFNSKEITLDLKIDLSEVFVLGNSNELKRSIQNILSNALDFTPESSEIQVTLEQLNTVALLSIKDSGKGFSEEALKYAKEQFYMDDSARTRKKHYGLGLSITDHIIQKHHGKLYITNAPSNQGGKVMIQLPLAQK